VLKRPFDHPPNPFSLLREKAGVRVLPLTFVLSPEGERKPALGADR
jgi:hypothetical protein